MRLALWIMPVQVSSHWGEESFCGTPWPCWERLGCLFDHRSAGNWGMIEDKSWRPNRMFIDAGYGCVAGAYAMLGDVRVVVLTRPDYSNTLMTLPDKI